MSGGGSRGHTTSPRKDLAQGAGQINALKPKENFEGRPHLADTVVLEPSVNPEDVRTCLINAVNLSWQVGGNDGRCNVPANFVGWLLQEHDRQLAWREEHPYSEIDMDMHVEAVTKDVRAEIERLRAALEIASQNPPARG